MRGCLRYLPNKLVIILRWNWTKIISYILMRFAEQGNNASWEVIFIIPWPEKMLTFVCIAQTSIFIVERRRGSVRVLRGMLKEVLKDRFSNRLPKQVSWCSAWDIIAKRLRNGEEAGSGWYRLVSARDSEDEVIEGGELVDHSWGEWTSSIAHVSSSTAPTTTPTPAFMSATTARYNISTSRNHIGLESTENTSTLLIYYSITADIYRQPRQ